MARKCFDIDRLVRKAQVNPSFVRKLVEEKPIELDKPHVLKKLYKVLVALERKLHAEMVIKAISKTPKKRRRQKSKFDRRAGGVVLKRRLCRRR